VELALGILLLTIRIIGAGWAWSFAARDSSLGLWDRCGRMVGAGLVLNLLLVLIASAFQWWTLVMDWVLWAAVVGLGMVRIRRQGGRWNMWLVPALVVGALTVAAVLLPLRSEWLAGGWDPGLYQNNAISIDWRNGTQPKSDTVYAEMMPTERILASTSEGEYREVFPGVPIEIRDGSLPIYFFPLNSICGAWLHRLGGKALLMRSSVVLAFLGLFPAYALFGVLGLWRSARVGSLLFWVLSPLWWYHQAIPISEMLQLILFCTVLLFYLDSVEKRISWPWLAGLSLFAGTINRFDFPVFAGLLLALAAGAESVIRNPGWRRRILLCFGALALGLLWDWIFAGVTIFRLQEKDQVLWVVLLPFVSSALFAGILARRRLSPSWIKFICRFAQGVGLCAAGVGMIIIFLLIIPSVSELFLASVLKVPVVGGVILRISRLIPFHGVAWSLSVVLGAFFLAWNWSGSGIRLRLVVFALGGLLLMLLLHGGIASIYPWAFRRYFVFLIPFMALIQGYLAMSVFKGFRSGHRVWAAMGFLLLGGAVFDGIWHSLDASRVGDYAGLIGVIEKVDVHIQDRDLVVADDPRWGTPLLLMSGRNVLNGKLLWESREPGFSKVYFRMLRRLQREEGYRVLWLTSTDKGRSIYPVDIGPVRSLFEGIPFVNRTVVHSARGNHFAMHENPRTFSLYEWTDTGGVKPSMFSVE